MLSNKLDDVLEQFPRGQSAALKSDVSQWRTKTGAAYELFEIVEDNIARGTSGPWARFVPYHSHGAFLKSWRAFEEDIRQHAQLMTPYELVSAFGMLKQYDQCNSWSRRDMIENLRKTVRPPPYRPPTKEEEARRQQEMQGLDDPYLAPALRAGLENNRVKPAFLSERKLGEARKLAESRNIDVGTEEALTIEAVDVNEAVLFACLFAHTRGCDLFRGQAQNWRVVPSLMRHSYGSYDARWKAFDEWAATQSGFKSMSYKPKELWAIAQHYGLPSMLLDFSLNPRVAAFFATHGRADAPEEPAAIYCVNSIAVTSGRQDGSAWARYYELHAIPELIKVDGLFRMDAQEGAFLHIKTNFGLYFAPDTILFPRNPPVKAPTTEEIYPAARSEIETLVETFFANNNAS